MNFLAHIYLSGNHEKLMIGNFMGDFVKGNQFEAYDIEIQKGIILHRLIDEYTDLHAIVSKSKDKLRGKYRHYAGVIVDVFYDHFLAKNWREYHSTDLMDFTEKTYDSLHNYWDTLPPKAQYLLPYMKDGNWLYYYSTIEGINKALTGMSRRTKFNSKMNEASVDLSYHYEEFEQEFKLFFEDLRDYVNHWIAKEIT